MTIGEYCKLHRACPSCGSDEVVTTCKGYIIVDVTRFKDENQVKCKCGWRGIVHDLLDKKP